MGPLVWAFTAGMLVGGACVALGGFLYQALVARHRSRDLDINF